MVLSEDDRLPQDLIAGAAPVASPVRGQVYAYLYGGLGNQLFQAAFAYVIQSMSGAELNLIIENFKNDGLRRYLLSSFPRLRARIVPFSDAEGASVIDERNVRSFPAQGLIGQLVQMAQSGGRLYLSGFWQNEAYLTGHREILRDAFTPMVGDAVLARAEGVRDSGAIGVHVRRLGYGHMGLVKSSYYLQAVREIRDEKGPVPVHVFSDDPVFCKYVFRNVGDVQVHEDGDLENPLDDFVMLSACRHHVIANSSFSWWSAWLGETEGSLIYAPQPWIFPDPLTNPVPERWRRIVDAVQEQ